MWADGMQNKNRTPHNSVTHNATTTLTLSLLRGRRGTWGGTGVALVARLVARGRPGRRGTLRGSFLASQVAADDIKTVDT